MELRGAPRARDITEEQAETILNKVLDSGINYIDTSIDYGLSEERIGRYISHRRAEYYLASKCGCLVGAPPAPRGQRGQHVFTRENIVAGVEQSLARMKTDYLDVVQFHSSPSRQTLEEHGMRLAVGVRGVQLEARKFEERVVETGSRSITILDAGRLVADVSDVPTWNPGS